ncbi:AAA family ATPase [Streptomyces sp. NPDC005407]|uniref:NACHT domain-containing protein n=1 Tax=Streptomyces sp. NPDC005407 TaxID=3155340 RepID=UPI0033B73E87
MRNEAEPDERLAFFGPHAVEALQRWHLETGRTVRWPTTPTVLKDDERTKMATVSVKERAGLQRKVILKRCPPGRRARREPGAHREAEQSEPREWAERHLVRQPWDPILLPDGGYLMFMDIARGGIGRMKLLTTFIKSPLAPAACGSVVDSLLREWNPDCGTEALSVAEMLEPRLGARLVDDSGLHKALETALPGLWSTDLAWLRLPDGTVVPNPLALARGHEAFADPELDVFVGKSHGDLHGDNIAYPHTVTEADLGSFLLLDLDYFASPVALSHDPANLLLTVAGHWFDALGPPLRDELLRFLADPDQDSTGSLPPRLHDTLDQILQAGAAWADGLGWADEWRQSMRLSLMACGLVFAGWETADSERLWWYVRLSAAAADAFLAHTGGVEHVPLDPFPVVRAGDVRAGDVRAGDDAGTGAPAAPADRGNAVASATVSALDRPVITSQGLPEAPDSSYTARLDVALESSTRVHKATMSRVAGEVVPRSVVKEGHVPRIRARIDDRSTAPVPLLGEAGIGKSVLSAQIHDQLLAAGTVTPLLVNCEHVTSPVRSQDDLDRALGVLLDPLASDVRLTDVTAECARARGVPVVLILDTVDYLLNAEAAPSVLGLFRALRARSVLTVFTCRQHDFETWLQPGYGDLHVPREATEREVPCLTRDEVEQLVTGYLRHNGVRGADGSDGFVEAVLKAHDEPSMLADLIVRPLLLTMLCELFAKPGSIPNDLTATRLYARYYHEKVVVSRRYGPTTPESRAKQELAFELSGLLWNASRDTLSMWAPETSVSGNAPDPYAFRDLLSETVVVQRATLAGSQVGFRHQALTEYFIAMYLHVRAPAERRALLAELSDNPNGRWFAWPVVRHIVAMAESDQLDDLLSQLDLRDHTAFRAVAFGAAEKHREQLLTRLAKQTEDADPEFTEQLVAALPSVPDDGLDEALRVVGALLVRAPHGQVCGIARTAGRLAARGWPTSGRRLADLLQLVPALVTRESGLDASRTGQVVQNLLTPYVSRELPLPPEATSEAQKLMREPKLPLPAVRELARAFLLPGTEAGFRSSALRTVLSRSNHSGLSPVAEDLALLVVPWANGPDAGTGQPDFDDPLTFLKAGSKRSSVVRLRTVARAAHGRPELTVRLCDAFLRSLDAAEAQNLVLALQEIVKTGGAEQVAQAFMAADLPTRPGGINQVAGVLLSFVQSPQRLRVLLAEWFAGQITEWTRHAVDAYVRLVRDDSALLSNALETLTALPEKDQDRVIVNLASEGQGTDIVRTLRDRGVGESAGRPLNPFLEARLYGLVAGQEPAARERLAEIAEGQARDAARQAMHQLSLAAKEQKDWAYAELLERFATHPSPAVRYRALDIVAPLVSHHQAQAAATVDLWLGEAFRRDASAADEWSKEVPALLGLSHAYVREGGGTDPNALAAITELLNRTTDAFGEGRAANDSLRQQVALLKTLSSFPRHPLHAPAFGWLSDLMCRADLSRVQDAHTFAREAFGRWIESGMADLDALTEHCSAWVPANRLVMVELIRSHDPMGRRSPRLDALLGAADCHQSVASAIAVYRHPTE